MIEKDDLSAAVNQGLITEAQAIALLKQSENRAFILANLSPYDEPFELFKGFNEIFIVFGLGIFSIGWLLSSWLGTIALSGPSGYTSYPVLISGGAIILALSHYFITMRKMVGPAIMLTLLWTANSVFVGFAGVMQVITPTARSIYDIAPASAIVVAIALLLMLAYWWWFHVPFALAVIGFLVILLATLWAASITGIAYNANTFLLSTDGILAWVTIGAGLSIFALAMRFDMSDPHRLTRRAANGFWLHLIAAPAMINTIALNLLAQESYAILLAVIVLFAIIALLIDRRSFLIAGIVYCITLAYTLFEADAAHIYLLLLGSLLLAIGASWAKIRALLVSWLANIIPIDRLPPTTYSP